MCDKAKILYREQELKKEREGINPKLISLVGNLGKFAVELSYFASICFSTHIILQDILKGIKSGNRSKINRLSYKKLYKRLEELKLEIKYYSFSVRA
ncbi:292_t:CDS:1, partial [Gigaspora rosea]